jgi:hypothetical protein
MVQQVKDLQERVRILESPQSHADVSIPTSPNLPIPSVELAERAAPAPDSAQELHEVHGIQWQGLESSITKVLNQRVPGLGSYGLVPGSLGNVYTGDFGLFVTSKLTDKTSVLSEIVFEAGDAQSYKPERSVVVGFVIDPSEDTTDELIDSSPAHSCNCCGWNFESSIAGR